MSRLLRAATTAACALALLTVPPAHAAGSRYEGDCGFNTVNQDTVTGTDVYTGYLDASFVLYGSDHHNVVNATVTCELRVNGVTQASSSRWGSGVVTFADTLTFTATEVDSVVICDVVDFTSDDTPTVVDCYDTTHTQIPPDQVLELIGLLDGVFHWLNGAFATYLDPTVCSTLTQLAPGTPPVTVDAEEGDVFVAGELFWDCPPFESGETPEPWPPGPPPLPGVGPSRTTGGGYNTGDVGFLLLTGPASSDVVSACAYLTDRATGTITVLGSTVTDGASSSTVRCRLTDTETGAVLYDETVPADGRTAVLHDTVTTNAGPVTVCTAGTGTWADRTVTVGPHCRRGEPLDGTS